MLQQRTLLSSGMCFQEQAFDAGNPTPAADALNALADEAMIRSHLRRAFGVRYVLDQGDDVHGPPILPRGRSEIPADEARETSGAC